MRSLREIATGWAALTAPQRAEHLRSAAALWAWVAGAPPWDLLTEAQKECAARLQALVRPEDHPDAPRFVCPRCLDTGLTHRGQVGSRFGAADHAWFCTCDIGEAMEGGYWFNLAYPSGAGGRRHKNERQYAGFQRYLKANATRAFGMEAQVEALRVKYERERSRRLEAKEDES